MSDIGYLLLVLYLPPPPFPIQSPSSMKSARLLYLLKWKRCPVISAFCGLKMADYYF